MKKIIKLTESDLFKIIQQTKKSLSEISEPEPVFTDKSDTCSASFLFGENETQFKPEILSQVKEFIEDCIKSSIPTIQKFHNNDKFNLPDLVTFYVGTSSTGDFRTNKQVAEKMDPSPVIIRTLDLGGDKFISSLNLSLSSLLNLDFKPFIYFINSFIFIGFVCIGSTY